MKYPHIATRLHIIFGIRYTPILDALDHFERDQGIEPAHLFSAESLVENPQFLSISEEDLSNVSVLLLMVVFLILGRLDYIVQKHVQSLVPQAYPKHRLHFRRLHRQPVEQVKNRYMGVPYNSGDNLSGSQNSAAVQGSFQKLKELIWTERAKELTQQRRAEELAARAAVLKEIANGQNMQGSYKTSFNNLADSLLMDENRSPDNSGNQYIHANRLSISSGQSFDVKNANNKNSGHRNSAGGRASTRRIGSNFGVATHATGPTHKEVSFLRKSSPANTIARTSIPVTDVDLSELLSNHAVMGIPMTYPIRQSHFRERNRSLFKQNTNGDDYFHRENRKLGSNREFEFLKAYLNENQLRPLKSIEYNIMKPNVQLYSAVENDQAIDRPHIKNNYIDSYYYN
ncbi:uncharacterized protein LOC132794931 [Drosophila nasuta]|uniref:uncharacterized protein LOC132794931 n=1 Tax=Drosophila nasuta TaxID=42062 RepID=UPI00295F24EE|nr:uncharacterized protein LOC132794931 [Drosophila nasuta]